MVVKELLKQKGITAKELASRIGLTETGLSLAIREGGNPSLKTLTKIAEALEVPISRLFELECSHSLSCPHCGKLVKVKTSLE